MTIDKILEAQNIFDFSKYNITKNILTDEVVGICFCALKKYRETSKNVAILAQNLYIAEQIRDSMVDFVGAENVIYLPSEELIDSEYLAASIDIKCERVSGLATLLNAEHKVIILNVATALRYYPSPELFKENIIKITKGMTLDINKIRAKSLQNSYIFQNKVEKSGDFAIRGDIFDIFPFGAEHPYRVELFDDEVESIRIFSVETQDSFTEIDEFSISPATELLLTDSERNGLEARILSKIPAELNYFELKSNVLNDIEAMKVSFCDQKFYKYFGYVQERNFSIFDYFECDCLLYSNWDLCEIELRKFLEESTNFLYKLVEKNKIIEGLSMFYERFNVEKCTSNIIYNKASEKGTEINISTPFIRANNLKGVVNNIISYLDRGFKIHLFFDNEQQLSFFKTSILLEFNEGSAEILRQNCYIEHLSNGVVFNDEKIILLSPKELFGTNYAGSKYASKFKSSTIIRNYNDLKSGDYVVHEKYGVGIYQSIITKTINDVTKDYMFIKYAEPDSLYIPPEHFKYVRKYVGREGFTPKLNRLTSSRWSTTKKKVLDKLDVLAEKLAVLYRERELVEGFAFPEDDFLQYEFEQKFPHALTEDQKTAVEDIKRDMESPRPMDRLICGDVGFGKTEVAFRAAFKAINGGKQVLLLCPTTLLAKQHYARALERFSGFGVSICCLTRFTTTKEFNDHLKNIEDGKIHFVIGTHKALSRKIEFKELGLMIIDEEQRFGVEQKETITMKQKNVDVITLSATPIPRTLQQSLVGMKSISIINTAPSDRSPIQTYLIEHDFRVIYELIARELGRNGQVYYVHNNVDTLYEIKDKISQNVKNSRVEVVHGQMRKSDIDSIMTDFYAGVIQVLITTTIVENGIDVAKANLMIVENADHFGLAQLYQLKGRVGRSNRLAYAYLTYNPRKKVNEDAQKRLKSIQEFTELGSGYKIAQRDLMIRGAGDILGKEQAGFIDDVGIDLYLKLLNEAIAKKEGKYINDKFEDKNIKVGGYVPSDYANETNKFEIYAWIDNCKNIEELQRICEKISDIYGKIPAEFNNIIKSRKIKIMLLNEEFSDFHEEKESMTIYLNKEVNKYDGIGSQLLIKLLGYGKEVRLTLVNGVIQIIIYKRKDYIDKIYSILNRVHDVYSKYKNNEIR